MTIPIDKCNRCGKQKRFLLLSEEDYCLDCLKEIEDKKRLKKKLEKESWIMPDYKYDEYIKKQKRFKGYSKEEWENKKEKWRKWREEKRRSKMRIRDCKHRKIKVSYMKNNLSRVIECIHHGDTQTYYGICSYHGNSKGIKCPDFEYKKRSEEE